VAGFVPCFRLSHGLDTAEVDVSHELAVPFRVSLRTAEVDLIEPAVSTGTSASARIRLRSAVCDAPAPTGRSLLRLETSESRQRGQQRSRAR
jgi:hypothetical protein